MRKKGLNPKPYTPDLSLNLKRETFYYQVQLLGQPAANSLLFDLGGCRLEHMTTIVIKITQAHYVFEYPAPPKLRVRNPAPQHTNTLETPNRKSRTPANLPEPAIV